MKPSAAELLPIVMPASPNIPGQRGFGACAPDPLAGAGWGVARTEIIAGSGAHESMGGPRRTRPSRPARRDPPPKPPPQGGRRIAVRPRRIISLFQTGSAFVADRNRLALFALLP